MFPNNRLRRKRSQGFIRDLVRENEISANDIIYPIFIESGKKKKTKIKSMPGIESCSVDKHLTSLYKLHKKGLKAVAIFPVVTKSKKSFNASEAFNSMGLMQESIRKIKKELPDLGVISDVALDPYTLSGHDGILNDKQEIDNDKTIEVLVKQAISHAEAGADIVAPSDMMDGRIGKIRSALETQKFFNTMILSYCAKYSSNLYGPFRDAVKSSKNLKGSSKDTYQMDFGNKIEVVPEAEFDIHEGADILMVKPGLHYLDVISLLKNKYSIPIFAYHVSGEYTMIKSAAKNNFIDERKVVFETLMSFKRAGANAILTYYAKQIIDWLK